MNNEQKSYDELMQEIQEDTKKISSNDISLEEAMKIFEESIQKIKIAKEKLTEYKGKITKVLNDGELEEFNQ
ncbi:MULTISPECIES: exodeoxyribonuclease VII small subunit [Mycoplasma]|uniref:Exodeoxyribonuclease VII small subunit n=3 Tax=Mycoplasma TaxID=2093 RepID=S6G705_9MOLU|nr:MULTISPECIES: exodeoxyribonuclease VII small subunit [Mycoplasma]AJM71737.1 exodeoxyribonuclease VII small subunit [Mycoplasma yeatsii GM274B]EOA07433.1 putative exodeoxyribonuclease vii small subunit protein [Mycoplasma yeatsii 13926]MDQ0568092.1 exodeoxyribonuclease VII small subunit [Mycoplasma yeatsii]UWD35277.1 exodeoxyribonuclease VII small subunit [Mycoplasma cottewii]